MHFRARQTIPAVLQVVPSSSQSMLGHCSKFKNKTFILATMTLLKASQTQPYLSALLLRLLSTFLTQHTTRTSSNPTFSIRYHPSLASRRFNQLYYSRMQRRIIKKRLTSVHDGNCEKSNIQKSNPALLPQLDFTADASESP